MLQGEKMNQVMDFINSTSSVLEYSIVSKWYTIICFVMLVLSIILKCVFPVKKIYHHTTTEDGLSIIASKEFKTRTQGLMFCEMTKNKYLGMKPGKESDYTITFYGNSLKYLKPINLGLISFILPWSLLKAFTGQWTTSKIGDVLIYDTDEFNGGACVGKIKIIKHKGKLLLYSYARNIGLSFINIPVLLMIYMPVKTISFVMNNLLVTLLFMVLVIVGMLFFFFKQDWFNDFFR